GLLLAADRGLQAFLAPSHPPRRRPRHLPDRHPAGPAALAEGPRRRPWPGQGHSRRPTSRHLPAPHRAADRRRARLTVAAAASHTATTRPIFMEELIQQVVSRTGISADNARSAVDTVITFLKAKLPAPIAGQLDSVLGGNAGAGEGG